MLDKNHQEIKGDNNQQAARDIINNTTIHVNNPDYLSKKLPSKVAIIIPILSKAVEKFEDKNLHKKVIQPYDISQKINYNDLKEYKGIVEKYGQYRQVLDTTYEEVDNQNPGTKGKILRFINLCYDQIKAKHIKNIGARSDVMEVIRKNADLIMTEVKDCVKESTIIDSDFKVSIEEFQVCLVIIICHAFIACKILEEPK